VGMTHDRKLVKKNIARGRTTLKRRIESQWTNNYKKYFRVALLKKTKGYKLLCRVSKEDKEMTIKTSSLWNFLRPLILDGTLKPLWLPDDFYTSEGETP